MAVVISDLKSSLDLVNELESSLRHIYGSSPNTVVLRNKHGAIMKVATNSRDLFSKYSSSNDIVKLMIAYLHNHTQANKDGGLFTGLIACGLIRKYELASIPLSSTLVSTDYFLSKICEFLESIKLNRNVGKLEFVFQLLKPVLLPKLSMESKDIQSLMMLFAKVFAKESSSNCNILITEVNLSNVEDSSLIDGVLIPLENHFDCKQIPCCKGIKVLLLSVSLSVDSIELIADSSTKVFVSSYKHLQDDIVMEKLMSYCEFISQNVRVLLCQKVVHPLLKALFRRKNIVCVDRIGIQQMLPLEHILGCNRVASLAETSLNENCFGHVETIESINFSNKLFLRLSSPNASQKLCTLVLCGHTDLEIISLRSCYESCMHVLETVSHYPYAVSAGGCTETMICMHLVRLVQMKERRLQLPLHLQFQLTQELLNVFLNTAASISSDFKDDQHAVDTESHHHWINQSESLTCCCGSVSKANPEFITFAELKLISQNLPGVGFKIYPEDNRGITKYVDTESCGLLTPFQLYVNNITAAFQLAVSVLRVGKCLSRKSDKLS